VLLGAKATTIAKAMVGVWLVGGCYSSSWSPSPTPLPKWKR